MVAPTEMHRKLAPAGYTGNRRPLMSDKMADPGFWLDRAIHEVVFHMAFRSGDPPPLNATTVDNEHPPKKGSSTYSSQHP